MQNIKSGIVILLLALVPSGLGGYVVLLGSEPMRNIDRPDIRTAEPGFARVTVTPLLTSMQFLSGGSSTGYDFLLTTHDGLLLYVPRGSELGEALAAYQPNPNLPPTPEASALIERAWILEGSLYELGDYPAMTSHIAGYVVDDYAEELGMTEGRVLEVDHGRGSVMFIGALPIGMCGLPMVLFALFSLVKGARQLRRGKGAG